MQPGGLAPKVFWLRPWNRPWSCTSLWSWWLTQALGGAVFGASRFSGVFARISRILKNRPRNAWETAFRRETPILTPIEKRLAQPQRPLRILVLSYVVEGSCLAWSWAFQGCTQGSHIQKIRQTNTAETPLVILIKKTPRNQKEKKNAKICARLYPAFAALTHLPFKNSGDVVGVVQKLL